MRLLLDTHILIWLANDPSKLSDYERAALFAANKISVSAITLWELRIKWEAVDRFGRRKGVLDSAAAAAYADQSSFAIEPLDRDAATLTLAVPMEHPDPFDCALMIHAQKLGARLLTRDRRLLGHPLVYSL